MIFFTASFVIFYLIVLCVGWMMREGHRAAYRNFLLMASLVFYAWVAGLGYVPLVFIVAGLNWWCVRAMEGKGMRKRKQLVGVTVAAHIALLAFFKYYGVAVEGLAGLFGGSGEWLLTGHAISLALPIGLSFYSFQGLSYTLDHYREDALAARGYADVLCFVAFFPTVMSGPIMRENNFFPQLRTGFAGREDLPEGITLILSGLFKKVVMATYLGQELVDGVFAAPGEYSSAAALMAVYAYSVQIYCDFSGYTDMAMGIARLMGFHLPRNFDAPYRALSLRDFWQRWHITLSTWLRDYLYLPLGGTRRGSRSLNLVITMSVAGIWHGSSLGFLVWGILHGVGLANEYAWQHVTSRVRLNIPALKCAGGVLSWLLTLHVVAVLWVFFRAESVGKACDLLRRIGDGDQVGNGFAMGVVVVTLWGFLLSALGGKLYRFAVRILGALPWPLQGIIAGLFICFIMNMGTENIHPFIYSRF